MGDARRVAVAGANGKTTTTSMLVVALIAARARTPRSRRAARSPSSARTPPCGTGDAFVVEADESDGSFLAYRPHVAVVTNVQADHLDFYGTLAGVEAAYEAFVDTIPDGGLLVVCLDDPGARALAARAAAEGRGSSTYGFADGADLRVLRTAADGLGSRSVVAARGRRA